MYQDHKLKKGPIVLICVLVAALILAVSFSLFSGVGENTDETSEYAIRQAVERTAAQCYAIEGCYPESLEYLEENYGLRVNTQDYYVSYEIFAENYPPNIKVVKKQQG